MNEHPIDRLSDYIDGTLPARERTRLEAHLAACTSCAATLDELRAVVVHAARLPEPAPPEDLWPSIAARLTPRAAPRPGWRERLAGRWRVTLSLPQLAAASLALMVISGGAVWWALQGSPARVTVPRTTPVATRAGERMDEGAPSGRVADRGAGRTTAARDDTPAQSDEAGSEASMATLATFDESKYDAAVAELTRVLRDHRDQLDTATVRVLEENLAIIDRATAQARKALLADPGNPYLNTHLAEQLKRKIRLLQRATELVAAHG